MDRPLGDMPDWGAIPGRVGFSMTPARGATALRGSPRNISDDGGSVFPGGAEGDGGFGTAPATSGDFIGCGVVPVCAVGISSCVKPV
ncbi:MAG TPA: hypothetical protein VIY73_08805, partial [Polyangiaceae bacterium]